MIEIAIIGPTASGKTALALDIASKKDAIILSLDSLSVYKEIDIASAKPTKEERGDIIHFGIDEVYPNETFDVIEFMECYKRAKNFAQNNNKNLIIVGGTGFYLKAIIDGITPNVNIDTNTKQWVKELLVNLEDAYNFIYEKDKDYMSKIEKNDRYRIEKALSIYKQSGQTPSEFFEDNPKIALNPKLKIFEIDWDRELLRERIKLRTKQMIGEGIIDEVVFLEDKYTRKPNCMSAIGIIETLGYLDGFYDKTTLEEKIATNTAGLAKRQRTYNNSQLKNNIISKNILENLNSDILKHF